MKISALFTHNKRFPWVCLGVTLCCCLVTAISLLLPESYNALAWCNKPQYFWQYFSGTFLHGTKDDGLALAIAHLVANILMFLPYGIILEKLLGSKKFGLLFLISWLGICAAFQLIVLATAPAGQTVYGAGLSGSAYAVTAVGAYVLFRVFLPNKKQFFRQPLAYVFLGGLIGESVLLIPNPVAGLGSLYIHLTGLGIGILLAILLRKDIRNALQAK